MVYVEDWLVCYITFKLTPIGGKEIRVIITDIEIFYDLCADLPGIDSLTHDRCLVELLWTGLERTPLKASSVLSPQQNTGDSHCVDGLNQQQQK